MPTGKNSKKIYMDCRGFSLVELIVVVAIMAVMLGFFITGIGRLSGAAAKQCARQIKAELGQVRIATMGKKDISVKIYRNPSDGCYYMTETSTEVGSNFATTTYTTDPEKIGSNRVSVKYVKEYLNGSTSGLTELSGSSSIEVRFKRTTGGLDYVTNGTESYAINTIEVSSGSRVHTLTLSKLTGKVTGE